MKIWLDDIRDPPDASWIVARTSQEAVKMLYDSIYAGNWFNEPITEISFDHDLGEDSEFDGTHVANAIEYLASIRALKKINWTVHSMNPVGRENIKRIMESAERFWK